MIRSIIFLTLFVNSVLLFASERYVLRGEVTESVYNKNVKWAIIKIVNSSLSTSTNTEGNFELKLPQGKFKIACIATGYKPDTLIVNIPTDKEISFNLEIADFETENVIVYAEGPGVRMMRKVIERKIKQKELLQTYSYNLYTKFVVSTDTLTAGRTDMLVDTTINSILETVSKSYYKKSDSYFSEIIHKRQSINVPSQANLIAFGNTINIYDDIVKIINEIIYTPFNKDAIDFYDFVLEGKIRLSNRKKIHKIKVIPKSGQRKLFKGYLYIDSASFRPIDVDLTINKAVLLPFGASLQFKQTFLELDKMILPESMRIFSNVKANLFWIVKPRLDILIESMAYNYQVNVAIDDELFQRRRVENAEYIDFENDEYWDNNPIIPLRDKEKAAYTAIKALRDNPDSLQGSSYFDKVFSPITKFLRILNREPFTKTSNMIKFNRVSGLDLGVDMRKEFFKYTEANFHLSYAISDQRGNFNLGINQFLNKSKNYSLQGKVYDKTVRSDNPYVVSDRTITWISLLSNLDYGDYFYNKGFELGIEAGYGQLKFIQRRRYERPFRYRLFYRNELNNSASKNTEFAFFNRNENYRDNPEIFDGFNRSLGTEIFLNYNRYRSISNYGLYFQAEFSDKKYLKSDFEYKQYYGEFYWKTRTLPLWELTMNLNVSYSEGILPPQKFYSLESGYGVTASNGSFRNMKSKEFYGDKSITLISEHNFGEIIPGVLRIPNIAEFGLEFILINNIGWSDFNQSTIDNYSSVNTNFNYNYTNKFKEQVYYELGIGINRVFIFFRFDLVARMTQVNTPEFRFKITGASF